MYSYEQKNARWTLPVDGIIERSGHYHPYWTPKHRSCGSQIICRIIFIIIIIIFIIIIITTITIIIMMMIIINWLVIPYAVTGSKMATIKFLNTLLTSWPVNGWSNPRFQSWRKKWTPWVTTISGILFTVRWQTISRLKLRYHCGIFQHVLVYFG